MNLYFLQKYPVFFYISGFTKSVCWGRFPQVLSEPCPLQRQGNDGVRRSDSKYTKPKKYKILKNIRKPIPGSSYSISKRESLSEEAPQEGTWKVLTITHRLLNRSEQGVQSDHTKQHWKRHRVKKDYRIIKVGRNLQDCLVQLSTWQRMSDL